MERDMTTGKPAKILLNFTIPIFIGNVFQQFYSMADTVIEYGVGGCWSLRDPYVFDSGVSDGDDGRIYCCDCTALWGRK